MTLGHGLAAEYLFSGDARDTSGNGHHGVVHGATLCADRFGHPNAAYHFDGVDDHIVVAPPPPLTTDGLSVSAWARYARVDADGWSGCIVCQDDGNDEDEAQVRRVFQLSTNDNRITWHRMIGARDPIFKRRVVADMWYHVAAVYEQGVHRFYVDGVQCDEVEHHLWTNAEQPIHIGRKGTDEPYFFFSGAIDDVRIYRRALSGDEVRALFREQGFDKTIAIAPIVGDPISGQWGERGVVFLDLHFDGVSALSGQVMSGRPDNMAAITTGRFDRAAGTLTLDGMARHPRDPVTLPFHIEGLLDGDEVCVTATFGDYRGNHTFTKGSSGGRR